MIPSGGGILHSCNMTDLVLLTGLIAVLLLCAWKWSRTRSSITNARQARESQSKDALPKTTRGHGQWTPQRFNYPAITPCPYTLADIRPVPYRPFRWGEYHVTMGIRSMVWNDWFELDSEYEKYHRIRKWRISTRGGDAVRVLPARLADGKGGVAVEGGAQAAKELVHEISEYLSRRYPTSFVVTRHDGVDAAPSVGGISLGWENLPPIKTIAIIHTNDIYDLSRLEVMTNEIEMGEEALRIASLLVQDDIALMIEGSDGRYYFQAGGIIVPGFWRMRDKIGMPLDEIHTSGHVPRYKEKLQLSMERFFKRLPIEKPVVRNNYFVQVVKAPKEDPVPSSASSDTDGSWAVEPPLEKAQRSDGADEVETASDVDPEELGWSTTTNGPEDSFGSEGQEHSHMAIAAPYLAPATLRLRSERQTLRRLPRSGAVVFIFRTYLFKVEELVKEKGVPARLASAVRSWPEDVAANKGRDMYKDVMLKYLDECAAAEGDSGAEEKEYPF